MSFRVVQAEEEKADVQAEEKKFFIISQEKAYGYEGKTLNIYFDFRALTDSESKKYPRPTQEQINKENINTITKALDKDEKAVNLFKDDATGKSLIEKQLNKYTRKNTSDYFIHKDLESFLDRELDFYMKNEVVDLSDVTKLDLEQFNRYILEIKVIRNISTKIIEFLAQIENFQKKLWEKKKFVLKTDYCITLDHIDEKYYPGILDNKDQLKEWRKLFDFDIDREAKELKGKLAGYKGNDLKIEVLKRKSMLLLDTQFFPEEFKYKLLSEIEDLDEKTTGVLINSENYQALDLIKDKYSKGIKCCYIDPPFNTTATQILYKNEYRDSSWISLMDGRLRIAKDLLKEDGIILTAIDDMEFRYLNILEEQVFGKNNFVGNIAIMHNPRGRSDDKYLATSHEYLILFASDLNKLTTNNLIQSEEEIATKYDKQDEISRYRELPFRRSGSNSRRVDRPNLFYPIYYNPSDNKLSLKKEEPKYVKIIPLDSSRVERVWRWGKAKAERHFSTEFIVKDNNGFFSIYVKDREKETIKPKSLWYGPQYDASSHGTMLIKNMFGEKVFDYPKSIHAVKDALQIGSANNSIILDFFAGSGTTGHAILSLNKEDKGTRKFILVEMGQYFETVLKPRIEKAIFSDNWRNGKPQDNNGSKKQIIKYQTLEQYEDALENIELAQMTLDEFKDYFVKYMLDFESRDSKTFLNVDAMKDPFKYKLRILDNYEQKIVAVDLVETYNYLIGLHVSKISSLENKGDKKRKYMLVKGKRGSRRVIVIWRNTKNIDPQKDKGFITDNALDTHYDEIHINGDNLIENAVLIEEQFKRLMNSN